MPNELVDFWRRCRVDNPIFAHPDDVSVLQRYSELIDQEPVKSFDSFIAGRRFGAFDDHRIHLSLPPTPYLGDLARAKIVILLLNPGFSYTDFWAMNNEEFRQRHLDTLKQAFREGIEFPFWGLDPNLCWHGGFQWWEKKLRATITQIAKNYFKGCYFEALRDLSRKLASLELVPYHSPSFRAHQLIDELPSVKNALHFVRDVLVPDAREGKRLLIVTRQYQRWCLPTESKNVIIYKKGHTRGASLGPKSPGGKAILRYYAESKGL